MKHSFPVDYWLHNQIHWYSTDLRNPKQLWLHNASHHSFSCQGKEWKIYCCGLTLSSEPQTWKFNDFVWRITSKNCTKKRAARAARLFFLIQPIKIVDMWRCPCRCRRHFLNSLLLVLILLLHSGDLAGGCQYSSFEQLRSRSRLNVASRFNLKVTNRF